MKLIAVFVLFAVLLTVYARRHHSYSDDDYDDDEGDQYEIEHSGHDSESESEQNHYSNNNSDNEASEDEQAAAADSDYDDDSWMSEDSGKETTHEALSQEYQDRFIESQVTDQLDVPTFQEQRDMLDIAGLSDSPVLHGPGAPNLEELRRDADAREAARYAFNTSNAFDGFGPNDKLLEAFGAQGPIVKGPGSGSKDHWGALQLGEGPPMNWGTFDGQRLVSTGLMNTYCSGKAYPIGIGETLVFQVRATFQGEALGGVTSPFGVDEDPFYGAGVIGALDPESGFELALILTNARVFVQYSRKGYARDDDSEQNQFTPFTYLVPVAYRSKFAYNTYAIKFAEFRVLFQMDGKTLLALGDLGQPIARKFMISRDDYKASDWMAYYPPAFKFILGSNYVSEMGGVNTACQQASYEQGKVAVQKAWLTDCRYAPWQDPGEYQVHLAMSIESAKIFLVGHPDEDE